jgi:hypothetical protein
MTHEPAPHHPDLDLTGTIFDFTPVPLERVRNNGWPPLTQRRFIRALSVMGSVRAAARAVGMGRVSAYRLRERAIKSGDGADSFAAAWDAALESGRARQFDYAMDRAINGVTTVRVTRGGSVTVSGGPDMALVRTALRADPTPRGAP